MEYISHIISCISHIISLYMEYNHGQRVDGGRSVTRRPQKTRACPGGGRRTIVGVLCLEDPISHIISCISHIISCISHIISCITCVWRNRDMSVRPMCRSDQEPKIPYHLCPFAYTFSEACHFASTTHMLQAVNKSIRFYYYNILY